MTISQQQPAGSSTAGISQAIPTDLNAYLRQLIPRSFLLETFHSFYRNEPKEDPLDVELLRDVSFDAAPARPILEKLSTLGVDNAHSIEFLSTGVLPSPDDPSFPKYALALTLILDQGPRELFTSGINIRYINGYFDPMALKLVTALRALPTKLVPWNQDRWVKDMGYHHDRWVFGTMWFMGPITHSELLENHDYQIHIWDYSKADCSRRYDIEDPYLQRLKVGGDLDKDIYAFAREYKCGPPDEDDIGRSPTFADWAFWWAMIFHVHRPIIQTFGRYPYNNPSLGRIDTPAETTWNKDTGFFHHVDEETGRRIRGDVRAGIWRPLEH